MVLHTLFPVQHWCSNCYKYQRIIQGPRRVQYMQQSRSTCATGDALPRGVGQPKNKGLGTQSGSPDSDNTYFHVESRPRHYMEFVI